MRVRERRLPWNLSVLRWPTLLLAGLFGWQPLSPAAPVPAAKPNIVVILTDDLGYGDLSCYGATRIHTPQVDRLAAQGLRFTEAFAPASTCTPSRYGLLTGCYAWRQKARQTTILDGDAPLAIAPGTLTLPELLRRAGYTTGIVGKWHLGLGDGRTPVDFNHDIKPGPLEVGFDYSCIIPATVDRVPSVWIENHRVVGLDPSDPISVSYRTNISDDPTGWQRPDLLKQPADQQHSGTIIDGLSRIGYMKGGHAARFKDEDLARTVVRKSVAFIEQHKDHPFFLDIGMFEPHVPRTAEKPFVGASQCGVRGDVIEQIDWETGQILDTLKRLNLDQNTIVVFTSDNGPIFFDGYYDLSKENARGHQPAGGLRGWKYLVYEGGTRVPLIIRWPGNVSPGVSSRMFCLTDLLATCAAITGQELPAAAAVDSLNQLPVLLGTAHKPVRDEVVQQGISGSMAIRQGDWKYIPSNAGAAASGMGSGANPADPRFAQVVIPEPRLYNLANDPAETNNLAAKYPDKLARLATELRNIEHPAASIRGAVYVPAEAYNAPQMWRNFSLAETRRDFAYAQQIHLNALRIWASYEYWQQNPARFESCLDQLLGAANEAGIRILISLFEQCGVPPTPENMWTTDPRQAFAINSPGLEIADPAHPERWDNPRRFLTWFMHQYHNDERLLAIEVMNEPLPAGPHRTATMPFAKAMFQTAKFLQGSVPLTIGSDSIAHAEEFIPLGLDAIEFHVNFPRTPAGFRRAITHAMAIAKQHDLPLWLTEWQRLRPSGSGWGREKLPVDETRPNYASLASIVHSYPIGNFFWSLMIKRAYLPPQRQKGTMNGLFWPDGSVWSLRDARAISQDSALDLRENQKLPAGFLDYLDTDH
jgi:arylsulfatase A-like enzyme